MHGLTKKQLLNLTQYTSFETLLKLMQVSDKCTAWGKSSKRLHLATNGFLRSYQGQPLIDNFQNVRNLVLRFPKKASFGDSYVDLNLPVSTLDIQCDKEQFKKLTQDIFLVMIDDPDFTLNELILDFQNMNTHPVTMQLLQQCFHVPVCQQDEDGNDIRSNSLCKQTLYHLNYLKTNINLDDCFYRILAEMRALKSLNLTINNSLARFQYQIPIASLKTLQIQKSTISSREITLLLSSHYNLESFTLITNILSGNRISTRLIQQIQEQNQQKTNTQKNSEQVKQTEKQLTKSTYSSQQTYISNLRSLEIISLNDISITFLIQLLQICNNLEYFSLQGQISVLNASKVMIDVEAMCKQQMQIVNQEQQEYNKQLEGAEKGLSVNDLISGGSNQSNATYFDIDQFNKTFMDGKSLDKDFLMDNVNGIDSPQQNFQFLELYDSDTSNVEDQYVQLNINPLKTPKLYAQMNQHFAKLYIDDSTEDDGITTSASSQSEDGGEIGFQGSDIDEEMKLQHQVTQKKEKYKQNRKDSINFKLNRQNSILGNDLHYHFNISEQIQTNINQIGEQPMYLNDKNVIIESTDQETVYASYSQSISDDISIQTSSLEKEQTTDSSYEIDDSSKNQDEDEKEFDDLVEKEHGRNNSLFEMSKMRELENIRDQEKQNDKQQHIDRHHINIQYHIKDAESSKQQSQIQQKGGLFMGQYIPKNDQCNNKTNFVDNKNTLAQSGAQFSHNNIILNDEPPLKIQKSLKNAVSSINIGYPTIMQDNVEPSEQNISKNSGEDISSKSVEDTLDTGETIDEQLEERHTQTIHQDNELLQMLLKAQGRISEGKAQKQIHKRPTFTRESQQKEHSIEQQMDNMVETSDLIVRSKQSPSNDSRKHKDRRGRRQSIYDPGLLSQAIQPILTASQESSRQGSENSGRNMLASATIDLGASRTSRGSKTSKKYISGKTKDGSGWQVASGNSGASGTSAARAAQVAHWAREKAEFESAVETVKYARRCASLPVFSRGKSLAKLKNKMQTTLQSIYTNVMLKSDFTRIVSQRMNAFYKDEDESITFHMINQLVNNNVLEREDANKMTTTSIARRFYDTNIAFQRFVPLDNAEFRLLQEFKYSKLSQIPIQNINNYYERLQLFCKHEPDLSFSVPVTKHVSVVENLYNGRYETSAKSRAVSLFSDSEEGYSEQYDGTITSMTTGMSGPGLVSFSVLGNPGCIQGQGIQDDRLPIVPGPSGMSGMSSWQCSGLGWPSAPTGHKNSFYSLDPARQCQSRAEYPAQMRALEQHETRQAQTKSQQSQHYVGLFYTAIQLNLPTTIKELNVPEMIVDNTGFLFLSRTQIRCLRCASINISGKHINNTIQDLMLLNAGLLDIRAMSNSMPLLRSLKLSQVVLEETNKLNKLILETLEISDSVHVASSTIRELLNASADTLMYLSLKNTYLPTINSSDKPLKALRILECHGIYTKPPNTRNIYYPISSTILEFLAMQRNLPDLLRSSYSSNPYKYTPLYTVDVGQLYELYGDLSQVKTASVQIFFRYFQAREVLAAQIKRQGITNISLHE